ncbi:hypothetical protein D3C86_1622240 [compost metagenome]
MALNNIASSAQTLKGQVAQRFSWCGTALGDNVDFHAARLRRQGSVGDAVLGHHAGEVDIGDLCFARDLLQIWFKETVGVILYNDGRMRP